MEEKTRTTKGKLITVMLYPTDLEVVGRVMKDYGCNRSAAMRMAIRGYGDVHTLAAQRHVTVHELTEIISFSSFAQGEG